MKRELVSLALLALWGSGCATHSAPPNRNGNLVSPRDPAGTTGATTAQGSTSATNRRTVAGIIGQWTTYQDFNFADNESSLPQSEAGKSEGIAAYMKANPALYLGIDGAMDPRGSDRRDWALADRRVTAVRDSLIAAGVPASRIRTGEFGDATTRRDRRVEVLFATAN